MLDQILQCFWVQIPIQFLYLKELKKNNMKNQKINAVLFVIVVIVSTYIINHYGK
jgi:hypothetical protein